MEAVESLRQGIVIVVLLLPLEGFMLSLASLLAYRMLMYWVLRSLWLIRRASRSGGRTNRVCSSGSSKKPGAWNYLTARHGSLGKYINNFHIPDDCIDNKHHALFIARRCAARVGSLRKYRCTSVRTLHQLCVLRPLLQTPAIHCLHGSRPE